MTINKLAVSGLIAAGTLVGCMSIMPQSGKDKVVSAVKHYCAESLESRKIYRAELNSLFTDGTQVRVHCPTDPQDW